MEISKTVSSLHEMEINLFVVVVVLCDRVDALLAMIFVLLINLFVKFTIYLWTHISYDVCAFHKRIC